MEVQIAPQQTEEAPGYSAAAIRFIDTSGFPARGFVRDSMQNSGGAVHTADSGVAIRNGVKQKVPVPLPERTRKRDRLPPALVTAVVIAVVLRIANSIADGTAGDATNYGTRSRVSALMTDDSSGKSPCPGTHESTGGCIRASRATGQKDSRNEDAGFNVDGFHSDGVFWMDLHRVCRWLSAAAVDTFAGLGPG